MSADIQEQIKCVVRELGFRERVYPAWVATGKMRQAEADYQIATLRDVLDTLKVVEGMGNA